MSFFSRFVLGLSFAVSLSGCAQHAARTEALVPMRFAQALQVPVQTTLATARQVLEEKGFSLEEARNPGQLVTTWKEKQGPEGTTRERYPASSSARARRPRWWGTWCARRQGRDCP
ncbi:hypothetical protein [Pyxidicoccus sp. MSG2]|uniref:hypothetical protein n=1 Tax=Pyxidicoccus sp. MSG2 TaxID=2996790 RepID=UPI002271EB67|nr:hypothetical protein [Pyxidicoccus sp. MSG2]MCY1017898.1 hypothetical protein [Pyxidicoccus sp. MSG2]